MFKILNEVPAALAGRGYGAAGAGELPGERTEDGEIVYPAATHKFTATIDGEPAFSGLTDGHDHDGLAQWAKAMHGAQIKFSPAKTKEAAKA